MLRRSDLARYVARSNVLLAYLAEHPAETRPLAPCSDTRGDEETIHAAQLLELEGLAIIEPVLFDCITDEHTIALTSRGRALVDSERHLSPAEYRSAIAADEIALTYLLGLHARSRAALLPLLVNADLVLGSWPEGVRQCVLSFAEVVRGSGLQKDKCGAALALLMAEGLVCTVDANTDRSCALYRLTSEGQRARKGALAPALRRTFGAASEGAR